MPLRGISSKVGGAPQGVIAGSCGEMTLCSLKNFAFWRIFNDKCKEKFGIMLLKFVTLQLEIKII